MLIFSRWIVICSFLIGLFSQHWYAEDDTEVWRNNSRGWAQSTRVGVVVCTPCINFRRDDSTGNYFEYFSFVWFNDNVVKSRTRFRCNYRTMCMIAGWFNLGTRGESGAAVDVCGCNCSNDGDVTYLIVYYIIPGLSTFDFCFLYF